MQTIEAEIPARLRKLDTLAEHFEFSTGEPADAILRRMKEHESTTAQLSQERTGAMASHGLGVADKDADASLQFAQTVRAAIAHATPEVQRGFYQTLRLQARAYLDPDGVLLGNRNRFRIAWEARIPLPHCATGFLKRDPI